MKGVGVRLAPFFVYILALLDEWLQSVLCYDEQGPDINNVWPDSPDPGQTLSLISPLLTFLLAISQSTKGALTKYSGVSYEHPVLKAAWKLGIFTLFTSKNNLAKSEWKCKNQSFIWKFTL